MRILWITNILFPEAIGIIKGTTDFKGSGGWLLGAAEELLQLEGVSLSIAAPTPLVTELKEIKGDSITYYALPEINNIYTYNHKYERYWREIERRVAPDIIHIHGTEFPHGLAFVRACGAKNVVASIQGMTSVICKYSICDIPFSSLLINTTFSDLVLRKSVWDERRDLYRCGKFEVQLIKEISNVIGRTTWDKAHTWAINNKINYFPCNETLRTEFYDGEWDYDNCNKHSIFVSQPKNSVKGFHQLLKAMPLVLERFPDTVIRIPGSLHLFPSSLKGRLLENGYNRYLEQLISKYKLKDHLIFLGPLSAQEMKEEYLSANVFVSCSSIENSSNSIGEAQILGTPCIASNVGGSEDLVTNGVTGFLYRFEEIEMLAYYICKIFSGDVDLKELSQNEKRVALERHSPEKNCSDLMAIYDTILKEG